VHVGAAGAVQVHPVPAIETRLRPGGAVSVTVTVPLVGPAVAAFDTVTLYVAPVCPRVKFPVCVLLMLSTGEGDTIRDHSSDTATGAPFALYATTYHPSSWPVGNAGDTVIWVFAVYGLLYTCCVALVYT
jgi:hypothetical protein